MTGRLYNSSIAGLGNIAWRLGDKESCLNHASTYLQNSKTTLEAGFDIDQLSKSKFSKKYQVKSYETFEDMLEKATPDIVSVCSPTKEHFNQVSLCLDKKIPMVWLEKPPSNTLEETKELIKKKEFYKNETTVLVNYPRRYMHSYDLLKKYYKEKTFGELVNSEIIYSLELNNNGIHLLDIFFYIFGNIDSNFSTINSTSKNPSFFTSINKKSTVIFIGSDVSFHNIDISLTFEKARVSVLHGGMDFKIEKVIPHNLFPGNFILKEQIKNYDFNLERNLEAPLKDLIYSYEKKIEPRSSLLTSLKAMEVIQKISTK